MKVFIIMIYLLTMNHLLQWNNMQQEKLKKLKTLLEITNAGLTKDEFLKSFKSVLDHILKLETRLIEKINKTVKEELNRLNSNNNSLNKATQADLSSLTARLDTTTQEALKEQKIGMEFIYDKVKRIKSGADGLPGLDGRDGIAGKDADEKEIIKKILEEITIPEVEIESIKGLKEKLEYLSSPRLGGGGTSAIGIANAAKYFVKTSALTGTIDGTNKAFTVPSTIFAVLALSLNGEFIAQLPNYTISDKTITFSEAIPAAYSGKDFEIKYI